MFAHYKMNVKWKKLLVIWIMAIGLMVFFVAFGLSDFWTGNHVDHNPLRPFFRVIFGMTMSGLTFAGTWALTKSILTRT